MPKYDVSKFKLKFDKPRKQKPSSKDPIDKPAKAAKKRWWQKLNMGMSIGSNKKGVSKEEY